MYSSLLLTFATHELCTQSTGLIIKGYPTFFSIISISKVSGIHFINFIHKFGL
ncbi:hypothetical protein HOG21_02595 [bacterium]|nr:hypothetical protein [bacterium]